MTCSGKTSSLPRHRIRFDASSWYAVLRLAVENHPEVLRRVNEIRAGKKPTPIFN